MVHGPRGKINNESLKGFRESATCANKSAVISPRSVSVEIRKKSARKIDALNLIWRVLDRIKFRWDVFCNLIFSIINFEDHLFII